MALHGDSGIGTEHYFSHKNIKPLLRTRTSKSPPKIMQLNSAANFSLRKQITPAFSPANQAYTNQYRTELSSYENFQVIIEDERELKPTVPTSVENSSKKPKLSKALVKNGTEL
mgnify:CR=1 FL=1